MWTFESLLKHINENQTKINGKWVPCRTINYKYRSLFQRLKESYLVFKGKADIFFWPENQ